MEDSNVSAYGAVQHTRRMSCEEASPNRVAFVHVVKEVADLFDVEVVQTTMLSFSMK